MNFQGLTKIESPDYYLDVAIKRTKKIVDEKRGQKLRGSPLQKSKTIEITKLEAIEKELREQLIKIPQSYPSIDSLPEFYRELISNTLDIPSLKRSLGSIKWCIEKNKLFMQKYIEAIKRSTEITRINQYRREFYGRVSSTLKQIKSNLKYLEESRKIMMSYPTIKTGIPTVAIAGFPNVGKSTLLSKLTPAKPKIAGYAFTTTGINLGYSEINGQKVQFMDTPGTLARFDKQNAVERVATLALKYIAEVIIYVFDPTESYPMEKQVELLDIIKHLKKPIIIYISKTDIANSKFVDDIKRKYNVVTSFEEIKKELEKMEI